MTVTTFDPYEIPDTTCRARIPGVCQGRGRHRHHRKTRGRQGSDAPTNLMLVCFPCHDWIHSHPEDAQTRGWLVNSWDDEPTAADPPLPW
jgi:5-methylcytosine-specific restriction endonuclease McrA